MKRFLLVSISCLLASGCSNVGEKRTELSAAGFRTISATTASQLAKLNSLKSAKIVRLNGKRGTVYVFADHEHKTLMVGNPDQYQKYREIKLHQRKIDEQLLDAQVNMDDADWLVWGP